MAGWNKPNAANQPVKMGGAKAPSKVKGLIALALVVIGAVAVVFFLRSGEQTERGEKKERVRKAIAEVEPVKVSPTQERVAKDEEKASEPKLEWKDEYVMDKKLRMKFSTLIEARTNAGGVITQRFRLPNGKIWRYVKDPPPLFDNGSDAAIAMTIGNSQGAMIPPVPGLDDLNLDNEFAKSLTKPIVIKDDDPPSVVALKMAVSETREEIKRLKDSGDERSVGEILADHIELNNHNSRMAGEAIRAIERVRKEEGDELAEDYRKKVNESLKAYGIGPIEYDTGEPDQGEGGAESNNK